MMSRCENAGDLGTDVLKELRYDWEAADDDSGGELGIRPHAHLDHVVADVWGLNNLPSIVGP